MNRLNKRVHLNNQGFQRKQKVSLRIISQVQIIKVFRSLNPKIIEHLNQTLEYISTLQQLYCNQRKEISRLKVQIQYLSLGVQKKEEFCLEVQRQNLSLKQTINKHRSQQRYLKNKQSESPQTDRNQLPFFSTQHKFNRNIKFNQSEIKDLYNKVKSTQQEQELFLKDQTEFEFLKSLFDIQQNFQVFQEQYNRNDRKKKYDFLINKSEEALYLYLKDLEDKDFGNIYEALLFMDNMNKILINSFFKLKQVVYSIHKLYQCTIINETFQKMVEEICKLLPCDRASVFLIDHKKKVLWSKGIVGTNTIIIPVNKGIAGHVATYGETLNILDAHKDNRFNPDIDKLNNYRTKSVLCIPIMDDQKETVFGIIQAINRLDQPFFSKEDEGLLQILGKLASNIFKTTLETDSRSATNNQLRAMIKISVELHKSRNIKELLIKGEDVVHKLLDIQECKIYLHDQQSNKLFRYQQDQFIEIDPNCGIVGQVFEREQSIQVNNAYNNKHFNTLADINTQLPILCIPLKNKHKEVLGVIQAIDSSSIENMLEKEGKVQMNSQFLETMRSFGQLFVDVIENIK